MKEHKVKDYRGLWLPAHEEHMVQWMDNRMREHPEELVDGKPTYQYHKLKAAMGYCKQFRTAIDVGAHVGLWSMHLVKKFDYVHAFEPFKIHQQCFARNVQPDSKYTLYPVALGEAAGTVAMATSKGSSGDTKVTKSDDPEAIYTLKTLDEVIDAGCVDHDRIDFVKVDCEGYEYFVLKGGEELLKRNKPCVIVEQKPGFARRYGLEQRGAVDYLKSLGAVMRKEIGGDFILTWD